MKCISVIVAVYNVEKYIEQCLLSICNQTYKNLQIIVVDDGSTDKSGDICDELALKDGRIQVVHKKNEGVSSARNVGLDMSVGDYVTFVDGDDYIDENMYSCMMKQADFDNAQMLISSFKYIFYEKIKDEKCYFTKKIVSQKEYIGALLKDAFDFYYSVVWNKLINRDVIEKNHIRFDEKWKIMEDFGFVLKLLPYLEQIGVCEECLYNYRKNNISTATRRVIPFEESFNNRKQGYLWLKECVSICGYYEQNNKALADYLIRYLSNQYVKAVLSDNKKDMINEHKKIMHNTFFTEELKGIPKLFIKKRTVYWTVKCFIPGLIDLIRKRIKKYE